MDQSQGKWRGSRTLASALGLMYVSTFVLLVLIVVVSAKAGIPASNFTRDPAQISKSHPFFGMVSNIGILLWCSSLAICFFCYAITRNNRSGTFSNFILFSGVVTAVLMIDDLFLLHESIIPGYISVPETLTFVGYALLIATYLVGFRKSILKTDYVLLLLALGFFAASLMFDVVPHAGVPHPFMFEDGLKLVGIETWLAYFATTCFRHVNPGRLAVNP